jgi:hypothetical protein
MYVDIPTSEKLYLVDSGFADRVTYFPVLILHNYTYESGAIS